MTWGLPFIYNCRARKRKLGKRTGPIQTEESVAETCLVRRAQRNVKPELQSPGWEVVKDEDTAVLKCEGRIKDYRPTYLSGGLLANKLIEHTKQVVDTAVASKSKKRLSTIVKSAEYFPTKPLEATIIERLAEVSDRGEQIIGGDWSGLCGTVALQDQQR